MRADWHWQEIEERLEAVRREALIRQQLGRAIPGNLWARLLPPLRRLEGWLERHSDPGNTRQRPAAAR
ncbi:hypothetical protein [Deinococcus sp.]|uniref:hypothetical protein n=1 Tax=Deinococcus sp. TaxID=47478 RepID=UPI003C7C846A